MQAGGVFRCPSGLSWFYKDVISALTAFNILGFHHTFQMIQILWVYKPSTHVVLGIPDHLVPLEN